jgi:hypothetical protein
MPVLARLFRHQSRPRLAGVVAVALVGLAAAGAVVAVTNSATAATSLLSQGKPATASSAENAGTTAGNAVDGNTGTRWSSAFSDPQWLSVDLGATYTITQVVLQWEAAYGRSFEIQTSTDNTTWTSVFSTTTGTGGTQTLAVSGSGRWVRMFGTARGTAFGYSLWEFGVYGDTPTATCGTTNAALGRPATASSTENAGTPATNANDGNTGTRWSSAFSDPQWWQVDLGSGQHVCQVVLNWEAAYARAYQIQVSPNGTTFTSVYSTTTSTGGVQTINLDADARFVRILMTQRATQWGDSLWEVTVRTTTSSNLPGGGPLGPNVVVFEPGTSGTTIQSQVDAIFAEMESNQFGQQRHAILFKPGTYSGFNAQIGFYTSIAGLGQNPDQVQINGDVTVDAGWFGGNATQNFWRSAENFSITPSAGFMRWAVAQAAPFRRIDVHGDLNLAPNGFGWASGGYIADSRISGTVGPYSQQQWYTRDSSVGAGATPCGTWFSPA